MEILVIPVYNPSPQSFDVVISRDMELGFDLVIVVNDGSSHDFDETFRRIEDRGVVVLWHSENLGKGRAIKTAINYILLHYPECGGIVTADADGQHLPEDIDAVRNRLLEDDTKRSLYLGVRQFDEKTVPLRSRIGNITTRYVLRYFCGINTSDTQTGLRGIPSSVFRTLMHIPGEGYEYETNMLLELAGRQSTTKLLIQEIPIKTVYEDNNAVSHFNPLIDSIRIYAVIFRYTLSSLFCSVLDYLAFIILSILGCSLPVVTIVGRCLSAIANFLINRKWVFKDSSNMLEAAIRYLILLILSGLVSYIGQSVLSQIIFGEITTNLLIKLSVEGVLFFMNYYIQNGFVFRPRNDR